jgi:hypothetical protein
MKLWAGAEEGRTICVDVWRLSWSQPARNSCCVYYWLGEMSANTGCYYCACTLDSFVTMLNFFAIGLLLSHTPKARHLLGQKVTALSSVLKHSACLHLQGSPWGSCQLKCVIDFGRDRCNWVSQCKSWKNLAFTVALCDHQLCVPCSCHSL